MVIPSDYWRLQRCRDDIWTAGHTLTARMYVVRVCTCQMGRSCVLGWTIAAAAPTFHLHCPDTPHSSTPLAQCACAMPICAHTHDLCTRPRLLQASLMPIRIRLALHGCTNRPFYHIVVASSKAPRNGRHLEQVINTATWAVHVFSGRGIPGQCILCCVVIKSMGRY